MAKALNCLDLKDGEPCNQCEMCKKINEGLAIDITELDAASNNGVDNIRDIIDDVQYPPQEARFKVYIMDEVHMLSIGAVNAFFKDFRRATKECSLYFGYNRSSKITYNYIIKMSKV